MSGLFSEPYEESGILKKLTALQVGDVIIDQWADGAEHRITALYPAADEEGREFVLIVTDTYPKGRLFSRAKTTAKFLIKKAWQVEVRPEQIDAAQAIYEKYTPIWRRSDDALDALADAIPGHDKSAALIKTIAVDALYATRLRAIDRRHVAMHVHYVLDNADASTNAAATTADPELVEKLASVPLPDGTRRHYRSFASKYAHFFISNRFPILDSYAVVALRHHLAPKTLALEPRYPTFVQAFSHFAAGQHSDTRRFDRYLWIAGQWCKHKTDPAFTPNAEIAQVFDANPRELAQLTACVEK
jgi:hypothetical protein